MRVRLRKIPRRRPVQARSMATVETLLSAVAQILVAGGYEGATTNHIARRAGVSVGSLYQYFPNKEALLRELLSRHLARRRSAIAEALAGPASMAPVDAVRRMLRGVFEAHRVEPALYRALAEHGDPDEVDAHERAVEALLARYLRGRAGALRPSDPDLAARVLVRAVSGLLRTSTRGDPGWAERVEVEQEILDLSLRYLLPDDAPPRA
jgi:AcrR family transcriptional regulator